MEHDEGKHGEPWNYPVCIESQSVLEDRTGRVIAEFEDLEKANRAGVCVNACADMEDPEKEIARLREIEAVASSIIYVIKKDGLAGINYNRGFLQGVEELKAALEGRE